MKIFELKQKQAEALEELEWLTGDDHEEFEHVQRILESVAGDVHKKIDYWLPVLEEAKAAHEIAVENRKRYLKDHDANIKRKEKVHEFIKEHILSLMVDFGIDKHKGELFNCSHYISKGSLEFAEDFSVMNLERDYIEVIMKPKTDMIKEKLLEIKSDQRIVKDKSISGCYLVKKEILRVS